MSEDGCFQRIERSFKRAAGALGEAGVEFMLGGSLAAWVRGGTESCHDLDLMIRPDDVDRALRALDEAGMRTERPPEGWLVKAWEDDGTLIDVITQPIGVPIGDESFKRADSLSAWGVPVKAMALEDVLVSKLLALHEHALDYEPVLEMARVLREQIDWPQVRSRTASSPFARAFFRLLEELGVVETASETAPLQRPKVRVVGSEGR